MVGEIFVKFDNPDNVKPIYEEKIDSIKAIANPILRPILQYNEFHRSTMVMISKELSLYIENKTIFENIVKSNELYKATRIYNTFVSALNSAASVINQMSILLSNDKDCINQMIGISRTDYNLSNEYLLPREVIEPEPKKDIQQEIIGPIFEKKEFKVTLPEVSPDNPYKVSIAP